MATSINFSRVFFSLIRTRQRLACDKWRHCGIKGTFLIGGIFGKPKLVPDKAEELPKLEEPDPSKLSKENMIKAASIKSAEEVGTLVLHTALALIQAEKEYCEAVNALVLIMEYKLKVLDDKDEEARIMDIVVAGRDLVGRKLRQKRTLEMIFVNSKNMLSTAAEVAYMTGAEFAGSIAGDRIYKIDQHIKQVQTETETVEMNLRKVETITVEIETEHANKQSETTDDMSQFEDESKEIAEARDGVNVVNVDTPGGKSDVDDTVKPNGRVNDIQSFSSDKNEYEIVVDTLENVPYVYSDEEIIKDVSHKTANQVEPVDDDISDKSESTDRGDEDLTL